MESRVIQIGCDLDKSTGSKQTIFAEGRIKQTKSNQAFCPYFPGFLNEQDLRLAFRKRSVEEPNGIGGQNSN
jgi:hypothetical protein